VGVLLIVLNKIPNAFRKFHISSTPAKQLHSNTCVWEHDVSQLAFLTNAF
jgi:hypothetical protein